jgi:uncharacterized protein YggL (DUF469 family)
MARQGRQDANRSADGKRIPSSVGWFTIWLEFEHWVPGPGDDPFSEFFNCIVRTQDGRDCGLNVWTYGALAAHVEGDRASGENLSGKYALPPDLFVEKAERALMEEVVRDLLERGDLEEKLDREQVGFRVRFRMRQGLSCDQQNDVYFRFREEALGRVRLEFVGVLTPDLRWDGFATPVSESRDATEADREAVSGWLSEDGDIVEHEVGPLSIE